MYIAYGAIRVYITITTIVLNVGDGGMAEEFTSSGCVKTVDDNTSSKECKESDNSEHNERNSEHNNYYRISRIKFMGISKKNNGSKRVHNSLKPTNECYYYWSVKIILLWVRVNEAWGLHSTPLISLYIYRMGRMILHNYIFILNTNY